MSNRSAERIGPFQVLILVLSIYVLAALLADTFFKLPAEVSRIIMVIDNIICGLFLVDFAIRFRNAGNKWQFMKWGWIELLASIPAADLLRAGRLVRVIRVLRILRAFRSTNVLIRHLFANKASGTFSAVILISILLVIFSSISILTLESDAEHANIKTAEDALWWSFVTITTVGYGDKFPVTTEGRIIASVLMVAGVGLFGTFTGFVASWFVGKPAQEQQA